MSVKYVLHRNHLNGDPGAYVARVKALDTADLDAVIDHMILQEGSIAVRAEVLGTLEDFFRAIEELLLQGRTVLTPIANFRLSIRGLFEGPEDGYDPSRHRVTTQASAGRRLRRAIPARALVEKQHHVKIGPLPVAFFDVQSGSRNDLLTPQGMGRLVGSDLKFDPADPAQGVFFLAEDGTATQVQMAGRNMPRELIFLIPELAAGAYTLEVRAVLYDNDTLRVGALEDPLTVA